MSSSRATGGLLWRNPLLRRYRCSLLRPSSVRIYVVIYTSIVILLLLINIGGRLSEGMVGNTNVFRGYYREFAGIIGDVDFARGLYRQFMVIQIIILWGWSAVNAYSALRDEIAEKTHDLFRLLPLSALQKTVGILVGKNLVVLMLAAATFAPLVLFATLGRIALSQQAQIMGLLLSAALLACSAALLLSCTSARQRGPGASRTAWILALIFLGPMFLSPIFGLAGAASHLDESEIPSVAFYTLEIPAIPFAILVCLYLSFWILVGILRKFTYEDEPIFSRWAALLFTLAYEVIVLGLLLPQIRAIEEIGYILWLPISAVVIIVVPLGAMRGFNKYLECCGLCRTGLKGPAKSPRSTLFWSSNVTLAAGLFAIWMAFTIFWVVRMRSPGVAEIPIGPFVMDLVAAASFYLFLLLLLEVYVLYLPVNRKISLLLGFVVILQMILPPILAATFDVGGLVLYSPFGYFFTSFGRFDATLGSGGTPVSVLSWISVLVVNGLFCIAPAILIRRRYAEILTIRARMLRPVSD